MAEVVPQLIFVDARVLPYDTWILERLLTAVRGQLRKQPTLDAYVQPSQTRKGDFSILYAKHDPDPIVVEIIGIPDKIRAPIITTAYLKG